MATPREHPVPCTACTSPLSRREREILHAIAEGRSNRAVAARCGIAAQTVKNHVTHLLHKLGVRDRTSAVVLALQRGWLDLDALQPSRATKGPPAIAATAPWRKNTRPPESSLRRERLRGMPGTHSGRVLIGPAELGRRDNRDAP